MHKLTILLRKLKFSIKLGLAAGAGYYISQQGVWKESEESVKVYPKISNAVSPLCKKVEEQLQVEMPSLPSTNKVSYLLKQYWNKGVFATFTFLANLPEHTNSLVGSGRDKLMENPEIKNFFDSFTVKPNVEEKK